MPDINVLPMEVESQPVNAVAAGDVAPDHDMILAFYIDCVELAEGEPRQIQITLAINGMLVSGEIMSADEYMKVYELSAIADQFFIPAGERKFFEPRRYIHLKNATYFLDKSGGIPSSGGVYWRGRLSEVDGFNIGSLVATTS